MIMKRLILYTTLCVLIATFGGCSPRVFFSVDSDSVIEYDRHNDIFRVVWKWSALKGGVPSDTTLSVRGNIVESADSLGL